MRSVQECGQETRPTMPSTRQGTCFKAKKEILWILLFIWAVVGLTLLWFAIAYTKISQNQEFLETQIRHGFITGSCNVTYDVDNSVNCNTFAGNDWSLIPDQRNYSISSGLYMSSRGPVTTVQGSCNGTEYQLYGGDNKANLWLLMIALPAVFTLCLHGAEVIVDVVRDEVFLRRLTTPRGARVGYESFSAAVLRWQSTVLFLLKTVISWIYGMAMKWYWVFGLYMRPVQIMYPTITMFILAVFTTYLVNWRPRGPASDVWTPADSCESCRQLGSIIYISSGVKSQSMKSSVEGSIILQVYIRHLVLHIKLPAS